MLASRVLNDERLSWAATVSNSHPDAGHGNRDINGECAVPSARRVLDRIRTELGRDTRQVRTYLIGQPSTAKPSTHTAELLFFTGERPPKTESLEGLLTGGALQGGYSGERGHLAGTAIACHGRSRPGVRVAASIRSEQSVDAAWYSPISSRSRS